MDGDMGRDVSKRVPIIVIRALPTLSVPHKNTYVGFLYQAPATVHLRTSC